MTSVWWQNVQTASWLLRYEPLMDIKQERFMQGVSKVSGKVNVDNSITPPPPHTHTSLHGCSPQKCNKSLQHLCLIFSPYLTPVSIFNSLYCDSTQLYPQLTLTLQGLQSRGAGIILHQYRDQLHTRQCLAIIHLCWICTKFLLQSSICTKCALENFGIKQICTKHVHEDMYLS